MTTLWRRKKFNWKIKPEFKNGSASNENSDPHITEYIKLVSASKLVKFGSGSKWKVRFSNKMLWIHNSVKWVLTTWLGCRCPGVSGAPGYDTGQSRRSRSSCRTRWTACRRAGGGAQAAPAAGPPAGPPSGRWIPAPRGHVTSSCRKKYWC
jgi:hypothetical protein